MPESPNQEPFEPDQTVPAVPPASTKPDSPPSPRWQITCKTERDWLDRVKFGAEILGLVVLIAYTTFAALQWCANKKAADAAKSAADTAARQLELAERPWVDADIRINGPFAFNVNGASLNVLITTRNTGNSPAFNTTSNERLIFISGGADPFQLRSEVCKGAVSQATTMGFGVSLFPNTDSQTPTTVGLPKEEIEKAGKGQIVGMKLIVCLAYRPTFNNTSVYTTGYIFDISRIEKGLPRADFPVGQEISADQLRLQLGPGSIIAN